MTAFVLAHVAAVLPLMVAGWLAPTLMNTDDLAYRSRVRRCRAWAITAGIGVIACQVAAVVTLHISTTTIARAGTGSVAGLFLLSWALLNWTRVSAVAGARTRARNGPFPVRWLAPAAVVPALTVLIGLVRFRDIPATWTIHWTTNSVGDRRTATTMDTLFGLCTLQAMAASTTLMIIGYGWREGQRRRSTRGLLALTTGSQLSLTAASLVLWRFLPPTGPGIAAVIIPISGGLGVLVALHRRHPRVDTTADTRQPSPT